MEWHKKRNKKSVALEFRLRLITVIPNYYSQNKKNKSAVKVVLQTELLIQFAIVQQKDLHSHNAILIWSIALRFRSFLSLSFLELDKGKGKKKKKHDSHNLSYITESNPKGSGGVKNKKVELKGKKTESWEWRSKKK